MDHRLPDIQHAGVITGQNCSQLCNKARPVPAGEVNQDGLDPLIGKVSLLD